MKPVFKGLAWGAIGAALGVGLLVLLRLFFGLPGWKLEPAVVMAYLFGLSGWLLGVGVWDYWARGWLGLPNRPYTTTGWRRYFDFDTDHKVIGIQYGVLLVALFLIAGLLAMFMRYELMQPGRDLLNSAQYNRLMSLHGTTMIFVAVATIMGAFGNYLVPIMVGADDMAYPRLNALSFWFVPPVALLLVGAALAGGFDTGWTGYPPLAAVTKLGALFYNLAFLTIGFSSILGAINIITTVITMRAPGLSWGRLPVFVWSIIGTAILSLLFTQFIGLAMLMIILDRVAGFGFFDPARGGNPVLYQHVFWFYSHPAVYVMILPGFGIALEVISHFARKPLFAYRWAVAGMMGVVVLSAVVWAHHMFVAGMSEKLLIPFMVTTELISVPTGLVFLSALGTIWRGKLNLKTPMLFALAVIFNFLIGGITGVFLSDVPVDMHLQDTYFVVAHFHYTIVGGGIFGLFAGIYYWFPKITGRMYNERLGKIHFWWMFIAFNLTFLPMFWLGIHGMNRRIADYVPELGGLNRWVSLAAFVLGASFILFVYNMVRSWVRGEKAAANPWGARTLEWLIPSPPPLHNFPSVPEVVDDPYGYGVPGTVHARLSPSPSPASD